MTSTFSKPTDDINPAEAVAFCEVLMAAFDTLIAEFRTAASGTPHRVYSPEVVADKIEAQRAIALMVPLHVPDADAHTALLAECARLRADNAAVTLERDRTYTLVGELKSIIFDQAADNARLDAEAARLRVRMANYSDDLGELRTALAELADNWWGYSEVVGTIAEGSGYRTCAQQLRAALAALALPAAAPVTAAPSQFTQFSEQLCAWGDATFPNGTPDSIIAHLAKEVIELNDSDAATMPEEAADCFMLLVHLAHRAGFDLLAEAWRKLAIVKQRQWGTPDADGVVEHVRHTTAAPAARDGVAEAVQQEVAEDDECHDCEHSGPCYCDEVINE